MDDGIIRKVIEKTGLTYDDAVELVGMVSDWVHNIDKVWLESQGLGCTVCKFNKRNDPKAKCDGNPKDSPLPFCKDYWVSEGEW